MKKLLALLMALAMVFTLAACGGNDEPETTTQAPEVESTEDVVAPTENDTAVEPSEAVTDEVVSEEASTEEAVTGEEASTEEETSVSATLDVTDKQAILDYYNAAVLKTDPDRPKGQTTMLLSKNIDGDGAIGVIAKVVTPIAKTVLKNNSSESDWVPGDGALKLSDCSNISATVKNGVVTVNIKLKTQVDGSDADGKNGGPVARGIGTLGSIDGALEQLGAEFSEGRETVSLTYNNASIKVTINEKSGKITSGTWKYTVDILIKDAKASIAGLSAKLQNLTAAVDYQVVI